MCGIVGYLGKRNASELVMEGLKKLEYRGYDSAGVASIEEGQLKVVKQKGKISELEPLLAEANFQGTIAVGHTRWATHGRPSTTNSHPHQDQNLQIALVHNGIIENYASLKTMLEGKGLIFKTETDTEVLTQLIGFYYQDDLVEAVRQALLEIDGALAIGIISQKQPDRLVFARKFSPLVVGIGEGEYFIGSDVQAFLSSTNKAIFMGDDEIGEMSSEGVTFYDLQGNQVKKDIKELSLSAADIEKGEYEHFMLKEIYEQPKAIQNTIEGRISLDNEEVVFQDFALSKDYLSNIKRIIIAACGTSWHSALVAEYYLEKYATIPVEVEYAAEFRYRDAIMDENDLVITISQSGETADTLAAIGEAQSKGAKVLSIVNVEGSTIARDSDAVLYTYAGPEIGVASTKAFTTQLVVLLLFTVYLGDIRRVLSRDKKIDILTRLRRVPTKIQKILKDSEKIEKIAEQFQNTQNALYLGRGVGFPIGLEGALKLKEISYIHAEGYPAAEMKHGPIALIDENMPVVFLAFRGRRYDKIIGNIMEVKARKGRVIAIATEGNEDIRSKVDEVIYITNTKEVLSAILAVVPLQLLAYYIAVKKGCSVDQPRNLAKSVTVE